MRLNYAIHTVLPGGLAISSRYYLSILDMANMQLIYKVEAEGDWTLERSKNRLVCVWATYVACEYKTFKVIRLLEQSSLMSWGSLHKSCHTNPAHTRNYNRMART